MGTLYPHLSGFQQYYAFRSFPGPKGNFVPKGVPVGFEMAEKNAVRQTHISGFIIGIDDEKAEPIGNNFSIYGWNL